MKHPKIGEERLGLDKIKATIVQIVNDDNLTIAFPNNLVLYGVPQYDFYNGLFQMPLQNKTMELPQKHPCHQEKVVGLQKMIEPDNIESSRKPLQIDRPIKNRLSYTESHSVPAIAFCM